VSDSDAPPLARNVPIGVLERHRVSSVTGAGLTAPVMLSGVSTPWAPRASVSSFRVFLDG